MGKAQDFTLSSKQSLIVLLSHYEEISRLKWASFLHFFFFFTALILCRLKKVKNTRDSGKLICLLDSSGVEMRSKISLRKGKWTNGGNFVENCSSVSTTRHKPTCSVSLTLIVFHFFLISMYFLNILTCILCHFTSTTQAVFFFGCHNLV